MRQTLRRSIIAAATVGAAILLTLGSASPAGAEGGGWDDDWDHGWDCHGFSLGTTCLDITVVPLGL